MARSGLSSDVMGGLGPQRSSHSERLSRVRAIQRGSHVARTGFSMAPLRHSKARGSHATRSVHSPGVIAPLRHSGARMSPVARTTHSLNVMSSQRPGRPKVSKVARSNQSPLVPDAMGPPRSNRAVRPAHSSGIYSRGLGADVMGPQRPGPPVRQPRSRDLF